MLELILTLFFCRGSTFSILSLLFMMFHLLPITFKLSVFLSAAFYCFLSISLLTSASFLYLSSSTLFYLAALLSFSFFLFLSLACFCVSVKAWAANFNSLSELKVVKDWGCISCVIFFSWKIGENLEKY